MISPFDFWDKELGDAADVLEKYIAWCREWKDRGNLSVEDVLSDLELILLREGEVDDLLKAIGRPVDGNEGPLKEMQGRFPSHPDTIYAELMLAFAKDEDEGDKE